MTPAKVLLVVDDSALFRKSVADLFRDRFRVAGAGTCARGRELIAGGQIDLAILDERLPDGSGLALCAPILQTHPLAKVIYATAFPSFDHAVSALKAGAHDYLAKPFDMGALVHAVERLISFSALERTSHLEAWRARAENRGAVLIGASQGIRNVWQAVGAAAGTDAPAIVTGETGTGKNLVARIIHDGSPRARGPFVALNCSAVPEQLIEAELFGWTKGAFTGADASREGLLEMAEGGTLFLDEIGEMPPHLQVKLLSVLEDHAVLPLGGRVVRSVDVRILAATNANLEEAMAARRFRADLYYRLNVLRIEMPPLREHPEDIPELCLHLGGGAPLQGGIEPFDPCELARLKAYRWPGNVRELKNVLERARLLNALPSTFLGSGPRSGDPPAMAGSGDAPLRPLEEVEREHILRVLHAHAGNLTKAAQTLGIALSTLKRRVKLLRAD